MANKLIASIRNSHELIFKVLLFLTAITLVVFLLPKEAKFKYEFQKNKPWVHEDLLAPFDFAINKTNLVFSMKFLQYFLLVVTKTQHKKLKKQ